jgi:uncharacterized repeat protein (TIGR01451 family)
MMRSAATVGVLATMAMTVGTLSTLAARAGSLPLDAGGSGSAGGIRVTISDDTRSAHSGDVIDYTVRVENQSGRPYPSLEVFHLVPAGFQLVDSTPKAVQEGSSLRWKADIEAGQTLVFTDQVMAGTVEESEHVTARSRGGNTLGARQFSTTACARSSASGPALACGSVREELSDGPDAAAAGAAGPGDRRWQPGLLGVGLVAALFAAFSGFFRKRRGRAAVGEE